MPSISDVGGKVAIEWPKSCKYWKFPRVKALCLNAKLQTVCFDGCAFGVKSVAPSTKGLPIKKPWRVDTDMPELLETLNRKCSCVILHTPCAGSDTRLTESYTDDMAAAIHIGFSKFHKRTTRERMTSSTGLVPSACALAVPFTLELTPALPSSPFSAHCSTMASPYEEAWLSEEERVRRRPAAAKAKPPPRPTSPGPEGTPRPSTSPRPSKSPPHRQEGATPGMASGALRPTGPPGPPHPPPGPPSHVPVKAPPPAYAHLPMVGGVAAKPKMPPGVPVKAPPESIIREVMSQLQPKIQPAGWKPTLHPPPAPSGPMATSWGAASSTGIPPG